MQALLYHVHLCLTVVVRKVVPKLRIISNLGSANNQELSLKQGARICCKFCDLDVERARNLGESEWWPDDAQESFICRHCWLHFLRLVLTFHNI